MLSLDIAADGTVSRADVSGDLDHELTRACIADELATWKFKPANIARVVRQQIDLLHLD